MKISIVTVSYNSGKSIRRTIESVINQTYSNIEYIIIDGGSQDETLSIIEEYKNKISHVVSEPDKGIYDAMNKGIDLSNGDIIHILNSDDYYLSEYILEKVSAGFEKNPAINFIACNVLYDMPNKSKVIGMKANDPFTILHPGLFASAEFYKENKFDLQYRYASDRDFLIKIPVSELIQEKYVAVVMPAGGAGSNSHAGKESLQILLKHRKYFRYTRNLLRRTIKQMLNK